MLIPIGETAGAADLKRERILNGAMTAFLAYGFARTTMDDIARAAEVSRPTLYLSFRNKADIFRAIGASVLDICLVKVQEGLSEEGTIAERLMAALDRSVFELMKLIDDSPHGEEILEVESRICCDIVDEWRKGMIDAVAKAIAEEAERTDAVLDVHGLSPRALAEMLLDGLEGMRVRRLCGEPVVEGVRRLVTVIEITLNASPRSNGQAKN